MQFTCRVLTACAYSVSTSNNQWCCASVYLDDLIIPVENESEAVEKLRQVAASEYGLVINWQKCRFLIKQVDYLGYIVESGQIRPSRQKTLAVSRFSEPTTIKQVQSFLGLTRYLHKFIESYAVIAQLLSQLLRNDVKFEFGSPEKESVEELKKPLIENPILKLYQVGAKSDPHPDACKEGLGAVLLQKNVSDENFHPIYYASWKTSPTEEKYTSYELEILAVVKALKKFRVYLLNIPFKIVPDYSAFI